MMISIDLSQEMLAVDVFTALQFSLEHRRKDILRSLRPCGDQALLSSRKLFLKLMIMYRVSPVKNVKTFGSSSSVLSQVDQPIDDCAKDDGSGICL